MTTSGRFAYQPIVVPVVIVTLVMTAEIITKEIVLLGLLSVGAPLAAVSASLVATAGVGLFALAAGVLVGLSTGYAWTGDHVTGLAGILAVGVTSVVAASRRQKREALLIRVSEVARVAQEAILSSVPSTVGHVAVAVRYRSAVPEALVGGDLYEVLNTPYGVRMIVGDVRGKGFDAVRLASNVMTVFRQAAFDQVDLVEVADAVDRAVTRLLGEEDFVTAVFAEIAERGELSLLNCGHPPPVLVRDQRVVQLDVVSASPPLGLRAGAGTVDRHRLEPGDRILFYSDGLTEARDARGDFFPLLPYAAEALSGVTLDAALDRLLRAVDAHAGGAPDDDLALVLVQLPGLDG